MSIIKEFERTTKSFRRHYPPHEADAPILKVSGLSVIYDSGPALQDVSFQLPHGMRLGIVGPNGAGKSTLLKVIAGVLPPSQGEVLISGHDTPERHICIAYVPQRTQVDWNFPVQVRDVVMMGRTSKLGLLRRPSPRDWEAVDEALRVVNLNDLSKRQIGELSGGQQQRMFIARALAQEAELMLMDEPLTGLDVRSQEDIFAILDSLRERQVTVLVALHDLQMAAVRFDEVMLLNHRLVDLGTPAQVFRAENLASAYGSHRLAENAGWLSISDTCCTDEDHNHA